MEVQLEHPAEEIRRLRRCINDLVSVIALPAMWSGSERSQIVRTLLDVLLEMLHLDLVYVRLKEPTGEAPIEMARVAQPQSLKAVPQQIGELLHRYLGEDPQNWPLSVRNRIGDDDISILPLRLGLQGEIGFIVAGSQRLDFPGQTERLLLSVAANQATIGLQEARLLSEQKRIAKELDQRVAQRTSELAAANEELKKEVADRRRAEEAVRESERNVRLIVDSIPGLVATLTPVGDVETVNKQLLEYCGRTLEELKQWGTSDTVHPDDRPRVIESFTHSITSGDPYDFETRIRRFDGIYRWFQVCGLPLRHPALRETPAHDCARQPQRRWTTGVHWRSSGRDAASARGRSPRQGSIGAHTCCQSHEPRRIDGVDCARSQPTPPRGPQQRQRLSKLPARFSSQSPGNPQCARRNNRGC